MNFLLRRLSSRANRWNEKKLKFEIDKNKDLPNLLHGKIITVCHLCGNVVAGSCRRGVLVVKLAKCKTFAEVLYPFVYAQNLGEIRLEFRRGSPRIWVRYA